MRRPALPRSEDSNSAWSTSRIDYSCVWFSENATFFQSTKNEKNTRKIEKQ